MLLTICLIPQASDSDRLFFRCLDNYLTFQLFLDFSVLHIKKSFSSWLLKTSSVTHLSIPWFPLYCIEYEALNFIKIMWILLALFAILLMTFKAGIIYSYSVILLSALLKVILARQRTFILSLILCSRSNLPESSVLLENILTSSNL